MAAAGTGRGNFGILRQEHGDALFCGVGGFAEWYAPAMPKGHPKGFSSGYQPRKVDPPALVERIRTTYALGASQAELAEELGWTLKRVQGVFRRNAIPTRRRVKRNQTGDRNPMWKGNAAGYKAFHLRLYRTRGRPFPCSVCGTMQARAYDWANLTGRYEDQSDYAPMCRSCHWKLDKKVLNLRRKEVISQAL